MPRPSPKPGVEGSSEPRFRRLQMVPRETPVNAGCGPENRPRQAQSPPHFRGLATGLIASAHFTIWAPSDRSWVTGRTSHLRWLAPSSLISRGERTVTACSRCKCLRRQHPPSEQTASTHFSWSSRSSYSWSDFPQYPCPSRYLHGEGTSYGEASSWSPTCNSKRNQPRCRFAKLGTCRGQPHHRGRKTPSACAGVFVTKLRCTTGKPRFYSDCILFVLIMPR